MASSILKWVVSHQNCSRSKARSGREEAGDSDLNHKTGECGPRPNLSGQTVAGGSVGCVWLAMGCGSTLTPTLLQWVPWKRVLWGDWASWSQACKPQIRSLSLFLLFC